MNVLATGTQGMIGSALIRALLQVGHAVVGNGLLLLGRSPKTYLLSKAIHPLRTTPS